MQNENDQHQLSVDNPDSLDMPAEDRGKIIERSRSIVEVVANYRANFTRTIPDY